MASNAAAAGADSARSVAAVVTGASPTAATTAATSASASCVAAEPTSSAATTRSAGATHSIPRQPSSSSPPMAAAPAAPPPTVSCGGATADRRVTEPGGGPACGTGQVNANWDAPSAHLPDVSRSAAATAPGVSPSVATAAADRAAAATAAEAGTPAGAPAARPAAVATTAAAAATLAATAAVATFRREHGRAMTTASRARRTGRDGGTRTTRTRRGWGQEGRGGSRRHGDGQVKPRGTTEINGNTRGYRVLHPRCPTTAVPQCGPPHPTRYCHWVRAGEGANAARLVRKEACSGHDHGRFWQRLPLLSETVRRVGAHEVLCEATPASPAGTRGETEATARRPFLGAGIRGRPAGVMSPCCRTQTKTT